MFESEWKTNFVFNMLGKREQMEVETLDSETWMNPKHRLLLDRKQLMNWEQNDWSLLEQWKGRLTIVSTETTVNSNHEYWREQGSYHASSVSERLQISQTSCPWQLHNQQLMKETSCYPTLKVEKQNPIWTQSIGRDIVSCDNGAICRLCSYRKYDCQMKSSWLH